MTKVVWPMVMGALCLCGAVATRAQPASPDPAFLYPGAPASAANPRQRYLLWETAFFAGEPAPASLATDGLLTGCCADDDAWIDHVALRLALAQRLAGGGSVFARPTARALSVNAAWRAMHALALLDAGDRAAARTIIAGLPELPRECDRRCAGSAAILLARASLAFADADRPASLAHATQAVAYLRGAERFEWPASAALLDDIADLYVEMSYAEGAGEARALAGDRLAASLPGDHPYAVRHAASIFKVLANDGETKAATDMLAAMTRDLGAALDAPGLTRSRLDLGNGAVGFMRADYGSGIAASLSAVEQAKKDFGPGAPVVAEALNVQALNLASLDRNDEAIARHREALAIREAAYAPSHPLISESANNLSVVFHNIGRYDLAEVYIARSLEIDRAFYGEDNEEIASALSNLAAIYRAMGDPGKAIEMLRQAVGINTRVLGRRSRRTAIMYHSLGQAYLESGEFQAAFDAFETSIDIHRSVDDRSRNIPIARHNMSKAAIALGRHAFARETLEEVLVRYREIYGDYHRHLAAAHRELAQALVGLDEIDRADESLVLAASIVAPADAPEVQWRVFLALAEQEVRLGHPAGGVFFGKLALEVLQNLRASQTTLGRHLQRAFARQRADSYRQVAAWLVDGGRLVEAQRVLDMLKDEEYYDFTRRQRLPAGSAMAFTGFEAAQRAKLLAARDDFRDIESVGDGVEHYGAVLAAVRAALAGAGQHADPAAATVDIESEAPPPRTAYLYYVVGEDATRVIAVTNAGQISAAVDAGRRDLARRVLAYRALLTDPSSDVRGQARELFDLLLSPVIATLETQRVESLRLRLDDTLRYLPFAALHDGSDFLASRFEIALMHPELPATSSRPAGPDAVAVFALTRALQGFRALPAAAAEAERIVRREAADPDGVFPGNVWLDEDFDRAAFQSALAGDFNMVHLASHFEFSPGNEKDSFLLLGTGERMTLYELRTGDYEFAAVDLLTMSGCNTALSSRDADGREIDGFATIAARKGAANIMATLWPVEDSATANFMSRFYALRADGYTTRGALRTVQAELTSEHPFYWAPFILWTASGS